MNILKITSCISAFLFILANFALHAGGLTALESELHQACNKYDLETVQKLINSPGVDVNKGDEYGCTPVMIASKKHAGYILDELLSLKKSDGSLAVNVNKANVDGITPLLAACQIEDYRHTVQRLLKVPGINVNQSDNNGETPLLVLCKKEFPDPGIIELLLKEGALNKANKKGETPLEIAKDSIIYGLLEFYLVGEVHATRWNSGLSAEKCKAAKEWDLKHHCKAKEGIAFHE